MMLITLIRLIITVSKCLATFCIWARTNISLVCSFDDFLLLWTDEYAKVVFWHFRQDEFFWCIGIIPSICFWRLAIRRAYRWHTVPAYVQPAHKYVDYWYSTSLSAQCKLDLIYIFLSQRSLYAKDIVCELW